MISTNVHKHSMDRCRLEQICGKVATPRRGFTLIELVLVLIILAILASAAMSMVDTQVDQVRFESTQQTLQAIERAVLGPEYARAADGSRAVSGFVADCGRLPYSLEELYLRPPTDRVPDFGSVIPVGDSEVTTTGGWNGPYLQLAIGATSLPDGWASGLELYNSNGNSDPTDTLGILRSLGRDQTSGGTNYDADLSLIFEADINAINAGLATQIENRWQKPLTVNVNYYDDNEETNPGYLRSNPNTSKGETIIVRVYGPVQVPDGPTGNIHIGTIGHEDREYSAETNLSLEFSDPLPIGPRIIRAYQLDIDHNSLPENSADKNALELSNHSNLTAVSLPTRVVISHETSSIDLILRNVP